MAKRLADKELTDRNWDQEEETEDAGIFSVASQDILKGREIKKAKRRNPGSESESSGAFKGFTGLFPSSGGAFSAFGNGSGVKPAAGLTNGSGTATASLFINLKSTADEKPTFASAFANGPLSSQTDGSSNTAKTNGERPSSTSGSAPNKPCNNSDYNKQLSSLNRCVRDWIVKHVDANPLCDLTPIFKDYEKHLSSIELKYGASTDSGSESDGANKAAQTQTIPTFGTPKSANKGAPSSTSKESASDAQGKKAQPAPTFNFGQKVDASAFGSGGAAGFTFSSGATSLFGKEIKSSTVAVPPAESSGNSEDTGAGEEEDEPPKAQIQEVKEDDAFYSKKCKLFYKKDNEFKEKGVGTLHLKPVGNRKTQLLIRADTNLGNVLLNILVQPSMPCSRTGKNNVLIVCVPNPPIDEKNPTVPITMLLRVKSTEDADELHKILLEKKEA
ncbi:nuclear pore complex protein Nup50 isoform 3-T3 [Pelodytes ibericus]